MSQNPVFAEAFASIAAASIFLSPPDRRSRLCERLVVFTPNFAAQNSPPEGAESEMLVDILCNGVIDCEKRITVLS